MINIPHCIDCGKLLSISGYYLKSKRCKSCSHKGKLHPNYKHGKRCKNVKYYCINCGIEISDYKAQRCQKCAGKLSTKKGKEHHRFKNGKPKCQNCRKKLTHYDTKLCQECYLKNIKGRNHPMYGKVANHGGRIPYKNIWMRSSYEIKYAKYLDNQGLKWLYESKTFELGDTTYTPDFYLLETGEYIEIKGWWRDKALNKYLAFKLLYPEIIIKILYKQDLIKIGAL